MLKSVPNSENPLARQTNETPEVRCRVLIAEDYAELRETLATGIEDFGFDVSCAVNGREALSLLLQDAQTWHALITDFDMPQMNGFELVRAVVSLGVLVERIILVSGSAGDVVTQSIPSLGNIAVLKKPFSISELRGKLVLNEITECLR
jgi:CheY-like chemotaxis protein